MEAWEQQHDARVRERRECEKQMQRMELMRKAQENQRTKEHEQLCRLNFHEWLSKKHEQNPSLFTPISRRGSSLKSKSARESLRLVVSKPRLTLATFGMSVPATRRRLELSEFTPG